MSQEALFLDADSPSAHGLPPSRSRSRSAGRSRSPSVSRADNTLRALTERFVELIQNSEGQVIEIDEASVRLAIQKRRIYDITNVLEGIGYIEKLGKNQMKWVGGLTGDHLEQQATDLDTRTAALDRSHAQIDAQIAALKHLLQATTADAPSLGFLNSQDLARVFRATASGRMVVYMGGVGDRIALEAAQHSHATSCIIETPYPNARILNCYPAQMELEHEQRVFEESDSADQ